MRVSKFQMQSETGQTIIELTEQLEKVNAERTLWDEEKHRMEAELHSERATRHALDVELSAMREQLMKNVDLFESSTFQKKSSPKRNREDDGRSSRICFMLASVFQRVHLQLLACPS